MSSLTSTVDVSPRTIERWRQWWGEDFRIVHEIAAPLARVEAAVLDAALLRRLPAFTSAVAEAHDAKDPRHRA